MAYRHVPAGLDTWVLQPCRHLQFGEALIMKYEKPAVQRFGTLREITLGAGQNTPGDATNLYHRS